MRERLVAGLACFSLMVPGFALAQGNSGQSNRVEVYEAVGHDVSPPLRDTHPLPPQTGPGVEKPLRQLPAGAPSNEQDPVVQSATTTAAPAAGGLNFDGLGVGFSGFTVNSAPPDTNGSVGATQFVEWVNESFAIFNKSSGALVYGPAAGNTLWSGFGGPCQTNNDGDPDVIYDKSANRWVMTQFAVSGGPPYYQCVAVSQTSDATGAWNRYAFQFSAFNDYPKIGSWPDAYYLTFNMFASSTGPFQGAKVCALDRISMLAGKTATAQCVQLTTAYGGLLPADLDGSQAPPSGSPGHFLNFGTNSLNIWHMHVDFATPANTTLSTPMSIPVAAFSTACGGGTCIPQPGTRQQLDSLGDRLMYRLAYRNFGSYESLVVNHSVAATVSGKSTVGVRWYELRNLNGTPTVWQQGTFAPDTDYRWMGSVAMDHMGNMALGYSVSSSTTDPSIRYTGRLVTDTAGTMSAEASIMAGTGAQQRNLSRWGDYSSMSVDPVDDCTLWYTQEYLKANGTFNWSTRIATIKFASCSAAPSVVSVTPNSGSGLGQNFAFQFSSPNGYSYIANTQTIIHALGYYSNSCATYYDQPSNQLYLRDDASTTWGTGIALGTAGTLSNSQCSINTSTSSASGSGNTLTLSLAITFQAGYTGSKNVYGLAVDKGGNSSGFQQVGSWTVGSTAAPSVVSVTPNSGSGLGQTFAFQFSSPNGYSYIANTQTIIHALGYYSNSCATYYDQPSHQLYLRDDASTTWGTGIALGTTGTLSNSQCSINTASSSASGSGNTLTLSLAITFQAGYTGSKNVYGLVNDNAGNGSGWQQVGTWSVQ